MARDADPLAGFQPSIQTVELVCERLGELGYPIGADTARELLRAIFANEAPRLDARLRDALSTSLETIRTAAQSAIGVLGSTAPVMPAPRLRSFGRTSGGKPKPEEPVDDTSPSRDGTERGRDELDGGERRPMFRRPRGR